MLLGRRALSGKLKLMNKLILFVGLISAAVFALATPADEQALKAAYSAIDQAISRKDVATVRKYVSKDAVWNNKGMGKVKGEQALASLEQQMKMVQSMSMVTKILSIKVNGATATIKTTGVMKMKVNNPQTKKVSSIDAKSNSVDTWVKTAQGWKLKTVFSEPTELLMDGKKMQMPAAGKAPAKK